MKVKMIAFTAALLVTAPAVQANPLIGAAECKWEAMMVGGLIEKEQKLNVKELVAEAKADGEPPSEVIRLNYHLSRMEVFFDKYGYDSPYEVAAQKYLEECRSGELHGN